MNKKLSSILAGMVLITIFGLGSLIWWNIVHLKSHLPTQDRIIEVEKLRGSILYFDEVLTMSTRMTAETGDLYWQKRYNESAIRLDKAIKQAIRFAPESEAEAASLQIEVANNALVELELKAFALMDQDHHDMAVEILDSSTYRKLKKAYADSLSDLDNALARDIEEVKKEQMRRTWSHVIAISITVTLLITLWAVTARQRSVWSKALVESNNRLTKHAEKLRDANKQLKEQTATLSSQRAAALSLMDEANQAKLHAEHNETKLTERNKEMEQFVYTVSHDLKNPLVTILGYGTLLLEQLSSEEKPHLDTSVQRIIQAGQRMNDTVRDLIELSRVGHVPHEPRQVDVKLLVDSVIDNLREQIIQHGTRVELRGEMPTVTADPSRLSEVLDNLITNALKYGSSNLHPQIIIGAVPRDDRVLLYVRDNGKGIPQHHQSKIFGLFQRLDADAEGTGVGLAIVKRIIEGHGGRVWVESPIESPELLQDDDDDTNGTTFWFSLPQQHAVLNEA